jgi:hypothetical protein
MQFRSCCSWKVRVDSTSPDIIANVYFNNKLEYANIYGEVKSTFAKKNTKSLVIDTYRLAMFCKHAIEKDGLNDEGSIEVIR